MHCSNVDSTVRRRVAVLAFIVSLGLLVTPLSAQEVRGAGFTTASVTVPDAGGTETGFGPDPVFSHKGFGAGFLTAGSSTRASTPPGQSDPFVLVTPPLFPPSTEVAVFIQWSYLLDGAPPATDTIFVNGTAVVGELCGSGTPDLCWGKDGGAGYLAILPAGAGIVIQGGPNTIASATDKPLGADPLAWGEGLTILTVFEFPPAVAPVFRTVDIYCGYTSTESDPLRSGMALAPMNFSNVYHGGDLIYFINAIDGQLGPASEGFFINGTNVGGLLSGTTAADDAWSGLFGPAPSDNLYDHGIGDLTFLGPLVLPGATGLLAWTQRAPAGADCIGHTLGAVSFPTKPTWEDWTAGKACSGGGVPDLSGTGKVISGSPDINHITLTGAPAAANVTLVVGLSALRAPFKGGILGPEPDILITGLVTNGAGEIDIPFLLPSGVPPCTCVWIQYWIEDAGVSFGLCSSNTLKMTTQ